MQLRGNLEITLHLYMRIMTGRERENDKAQPQGREPRCYTILVRDDSDGGGKERAREIS